MAKTRKKVYQNYDAIQLDKAVAAVKAGTSVRKASQQFGVPRTTIHDHVKGKGEPGARPGKPPAIPVEIEDRVVKSALDAADMGFGISRGMLKAKTGQLVNRLKLSTVHRLKTGFLATCGGGDLSPNSLSLPSGNLKHYLQSGPE